MGDASNGRFIENPTKVDDLRVPPFQETSISSCSFMDIPFISLNPVVILIFRSSNGGIAVGICMDIHGYHWLYNLTGGIRYHPLWINLSSIMDITHS